MMHTGASHFAFVIETDEKQYDISTIEILVWCSTQALSNTTFAFSLENYFISVSPLTQTVPRHIYQSGHERHEDNRHNSDSQHNDDQGKRDCATTHPDNMPPSTLQKSGAMSSSVALSHDKSMELIVDIQSSTEVQMQWLIEIHNFRINVAYLPINAVVSDFQRGTMIKVINGQVRLQPTPNHTPVLIENCIDAFGTRDMTLHCDDNLLTATKDTVVMVIEPDFDTTMHDFPIITDKDAVNRSIKFPSVPGFSSMQFSEYADMGFFNLSGFTIKVDGQKICHLQFWLADRGINCGIHDHSDLFGEEAFCEIHSCVVNGTGYGGMFRSELSIDEKDVKREKLSRLVVPSGHEHGPFWEWAADGTPARRSDTSIMYRPHAWIAGDGDLRVPEATSMDFWIATEIEPHLVRNSMTGVSRQK